MVSFIAIDNTCSPRYRLIPYFGIRVSLAHRRGKGFALLTLDLHARCAGSMHPLSRVSCPSHELFRYTEYKSRSNVACAIMEIPHPKTQ